MNDTTGGIVVLISGRGSNLKSIIEAVQNKEIPAKISCVISNRESAGGLQYARDAGIPVEVVNDRDFVSREDFDAELIRAIDRYQPKLVVLAGFMRILGDEFVNHYLGRMINIHPALLPDYPGLNTHERALQDGVERHGATVHFVTPEVDSGPIIIQRAVPVKPDDTPERLAARVLEQEHDIYPTAIQWFVEGRLSIDGNQVLLDGQKSPEQGP
ncbi:MAG: phosphoribosylglycinamide formyltransferase [Acidiferrobacterales bacterium]